MKHKFAIGMGVCIALSIFTGISLLTPIVTLQKIEIKGESQHSEEHILSKIPYKTGDNFLTINNSRIRKNLISGNHFADVRVSRKLPNKIVVEVVEHVPRYLLLAKNDLWGITKDGIVIPLEKTGRYPDVPIISPDTNIQVFPYQKITSPSITMCLDYLNKLSETMPEHLDEISEITFDNNSLTIYTYNDGIPVMVNYQTPTINGKYLDILLSRLKQDVSNILWIDLRTDCLATVRFSNELR